MMPSNRLSSVQVAAPTPSGPTSPEGVFSSQLSGECWFCRSPLYHFPDVGIFCLLCDSHEVPESFKPVAGLVTPPLSLMSETFRGFQGVSQC